MKVGDKVICIKKDSWRVRNTGALSKGPAYKEELIVDNINECGEGDLMFYKWGVFASFNKKWFKKPDTLHTFNSELTKELANIPLIEERVEKIKERELETS